jgi:hypothetical protein
MSAPAGKAARAILVPMQEPIAAIRGFIDSFDAHEAFVFMERNVEMASIGNSQRNSPIEIGTSKNVALGRDLFERLLSAME